ncbi:hypothetical protein BGX31_011404 [Mortierella sp. GBA43]|nr:hypothetical protein BGX31_011404 [Mortierella sp. GBA43]
MSSIVAASSTGGPSSSYSSIPSYLRPYISKEPIVRSAGVTSHHQEGEGFQSKGSGFNSLSTNLFSQSQELRMLLDRITSLDTIIDTLTHSIEGLRRERLKGTSSQSQDRVSELETVLGGKVKSVLDQVAERHLAAFKQETTVIMELLQQQVQQLPTTIADITRRELEGWERTVRSVLGEEIKELKPVIALQTEMLSMISEQNRGISSGQDRLLNAMTHRTIGGDRDEYASGTPINQNTGRCGAQNRVSMADRLFPSVNEVIDVDDSDSSQQGTASAVPDRHPKKITSRSVDSERSCTSLVTTCRLNRSNTPSGPDPRAQSTEAPDLMIRGSHMAPGAGPRTPRARSKSPVLVCLKVPKRKVGRLRKRSRPASPTPVEPPVEETAVKEEYDRMEAMTSVMTRSKRVSCKLLEL